MFHYKLIELEAEQLAREQSSRPFTELPVQCQALLVYIEQEVGVSLAHKVPKNWRGWLTYRRKQQAVLICRGREFKAGLFGQLRAGFDVPNGLDSISEYERGFDISPPQQLDHILVNFGGTGEQPALFVWYGENIVPYKLLYMAEVDADPHEQLSALIVEACTWILNRPKHITLTEYLQILDRKE